MVARDRFFPPVAPLMCLLVCACVAGIPATDTTAVATGIPQAEIEAVFGGPNEVRKTEFGTIALYRYDLGLQSVWDQMEKGSGKGKEPPPVPLKDIIVLGIENLRKAEEQKAYMAIAYAANGISIAYDSDKDIDAAARKAAAAADRLVRRGAVRQLGVGELFALARCGDANAQDRIGWSYHNGFGLPRNPIEAYFWYGVALKTAEHPDYLAHAKTDLEVVEAAMEPDEISAVNDRIESWRPRTAGCATAAANRPWK